MLYITQCTHVILGASGSGASGSSTINARLFEPAGTPAQSSSGEIFRPSQEWRTGIAPSCLNDGDVMVMGMTMSSFSPVGRLVLASATVRAAATEMQIR